MTIRRSRNPGPAFPFPTSVMEFAQRFSTEEQCWEYLRWMRWPGVGEPTKSPKGSPLYTFVSTRRLWEFEDGTQMSVTSGTAMARSKVPLVKWFWAAYLAAVQTPGISAMQLSKHLKLRYETAFQLLHKLRAGIVPPDRAQLTGRVEVDETFIGGRAKGARGRGAANKAMVVGAVEVVHYLDKWKRPKERAGNVALRVIPDGTQESLGAFLGDWIYPKSVVVTDGWRGYTGLSHYDLTHDVIKGASSVDVAEQLVHIHRVFSNLKTWLLGTHHGVSAKHLQAYLNEFMFRFNRRQEPFASFALALGIATQKTAPEYDELYHAGGADGWRHANPA